MQRGRILIVDDDPLVRDVLSAIFSYSGQYETELAGDGLTGLSKVRDGDYDMVFTDLTMPGKSGIDFMREAVKLRPSLPVVVITGNSTLDNAINAMREGAKDFITKPFNVATITSLADRIIGERRLLSTIDQGGSRDSFIGRLNSELFKRLQEISVLQSLSSELDALYNNKEIYEKIVEMISRLLMVKEVSFGIIEQGILKIRKAVGVASREVTVAGTLLERVVATGRHTLAPFGEINPHSGLPLTTPFLAVPFTISGEVFGIISLSNKADGSTFTDDEVSLALTFVKKAAQRIEQRPLRGLLQ
jgi:CheY-like chemotaxis protein